MAGAQLLLTASSYIVAAVMARGLGPVDYGIYGIIYSFLLSIELIGRLGISQAVARMIAERVVSIRLEGSGVTLVLLSTPRLRRLLVWRGLVRRCLQHPRGRPLSVPGRGTRYPVLWHVLRTPGDSRRPARLPVRKSRHRALQPRQGDRGGCAIRDRPKHRRRAAAQRRRIDDGARLPRLADRAAQLRTQS